MENIKTILRKQLKDLLTFAVFTVLLLNAATVYPIIIRHDRADADYQKLAERYRNACVDVAGASGTLIAPRWVLAAAHTVEKLIPGSKWYDRSMLPKANIGGRDYVIEKIVQHPSWNKPRSSNDIALVRLAEPVKGIVPTRLYREKDEVGKVVTFIGRGTTGNGKDGAKGKDMILRAANNRVETADEKWISFIFDAPDSPNVLPLEGIAGQGDSGGPALIEKDGYLYTIGVASHSRSVDGPEDVNRVYGMKFYYTRVSSYADWIDKTIADETAQVGKPNDNVNGDLGIKLNAQMRQLVEKGFSGVLFVAKDGQIVLEKGYGLADRENKTPYSADTIFDIGSITKQFTGAAILKLEMQGKLAASDKISKYFKGVPADKTDITLHHLLTHSAGLIDVLGKDYDKLSRDEMIKGALASKLQTAPGAKYEYSNLGYSLLAAIIEIVTAKSYEKFLHDNLFEPAGMKQTGYVIPKRKPENLAVGYAKDGSRWGTPLDKAWDADGPYWNLRGNGGILSTSGDLYKWHLALEGEKVLSKAAKEKYFAPHIKEQPEAVSFYGYGWVTQKTPRGTKVVWHNGGNPYFFADFRRYVDDGVVVIVATNSPADSLEREIGQTIRSIFSSESSK